MASFKGAKAPKRITRIDFSGHSPRLSLQHFLQQGPVYPLRDTPSPPLAHSTFDEERREVLESVLDALAIETPDAARDAACRHLLRHLAGSPNRL